MQEYKYIFIFASWFYLFFDPNQPWRQLSGLDEYEVRFKRMLAAFCIFWDYMLIQLVLISILGLFKFESIGEFLFMLIMFLLLIGYFIHNFKTAYQKTNTKGFITKTVIYCFWLISLTADMF